MDEVDRKLMSLLDMNPRTPYRKLADELRISVPAVYRRIQNLMKNGVIRGFSAQVSIRHLKAVPVTIFGKSNSCCVDPIVAKLGAHELTSSVLVAGGNYLYVVGLLRSISELEKYADFVSKTADISDATVGIYSMDAGLAHDFIDGGRKGEEGQEPLSPLDLRIISSLRLDCRRPVADIASELGVSAKTVSRRLQSMIEDGRLDFVVPMDPTVSGDIVSIVHIFLNKDVNKNEVGRELLKKYSPRVWYLRSFSNLPDFLICIIWTNRMNELKEVTSEITRKDEIKSVVPNIWYADYIFDTWRDKMLLQHSKSPSG